MGEKGLAAVEKLPKGYYIPAAGTERSSIVRIGAALPGTPDPGLTRAGEAFPQGRPGPGITWDDERGVWRPPGFRPDPDDSGRLFNKLTGQNAVWDEDGQRWIDAKTGEPISYEQ